MVNFEQFAKLDAKQSILKDITKFRELSPNKIQYIFDDHTVEAPHSVTITSILPSPRKGNPGTLKTMLNYHRTVIADTGLPTERRVPQVVKLETSFPVGTTQEDMVKTFLAAMSVPWCRNDQDVEKIIGLLSRGILL